MYFYLFGAKNKITFMSQKINIAIFYSLSINFDKLT